MRLSVAALQHSQQERLVVARHAPLPTTDRDAVRRAADRAGPRHPWNPGVGVHRQVAVRSRRPPRAAWTSLANRLGRGTAFADARPDAGSRNRIGGLPVALDALMPPPTGRPATPKQSSGAGPPWIPTASSPRLCLPVMDASMSKNPTIPGNSVSSSGSACRIRSSRLALAGWSRRSSTMQRGGAGAGGSPRSRRR